jgi:alkaline phosphatase D
VRVADQRQHRRHPGSRPGTRSLSVERGIQRNNPHVKYVDFDSHGFSMLDVTPERVRMDWFVLIDRLDPESAAVWSTSWRVAAGSTSVERASRRLS